MANSSGADKRPSMKDVARQAGVSQTTVSFVLNEVADANISAATQERVRDAVRELGYRRNAMARQLRANRTQTIGLISDEIATTPHAGRIIQGAQDAAWDSGYLLFVVNTGGNTEVENTAIDEMLDRRVDGFIYATMYHRVVSPPLHIREVPTVLLDCYIADRSLPSVVPNEVEGGRNAVGALLAGGHRRIGFINNSDPIPATAGRLAGYQQALSAHGISLDKNLIVSTKADISSGYRATQHLMALPQPPTAIFCYSDYLAAGAYRALHEQKRTIPDDVAIVGFDNQELIISTLEPHLTTMQLPHYAMGKWAVQHILKLSSQRGAEADKKPVQHLIECPLVQRASV